MTKQEKLWALAEAMTDSVRGASKDGMLVAGGEHYYHFTDKAPKELVDKFLEHYNIDDIDYESFSRALDIVSDIYAEKHDITDSEVEDEIYERATDSASVYTIDRLRYLNNRNESDISDILKEYGEHSIATACAIWYDKQVENQAMIIRDWVNA